MRTPPTGVTPANEVLIAEAVVAPTVEVGCKLSGGSWRSYYDGQEATNAGALGIDHMVPLAEAWDSGASGSTAARREAYANDQGSEGSPVAVTARTNRQKSDQDPADWMPPSPEAQCRYVGEAARTAVVSRAADRKRRRRSVGALQQVGADARS